MIRDSGAGKSETIEALTNLSEDVIVSRKSFLTIWARCI